MPDLTPYEHDTLKEICNIGAGNAANALSQMLRQKVNITVPDLHMVPFDDVSHSMIRGNQIDSIVTVIFLEIIGDAQGTIMMLLDPTDAGRLASFATHKEFSELHVLDEVDLAALRNIGNVIAGASLNSLSKFLGLNLLQSIPDAATDMLGAIVNAIVAEYGSMAEEVLMLDVSFSVNNVSIKGGIYYLFNPSSARLILNATNTKLGI